MSTAAAHTLYIPIIPDYEVTTPTNTYLILTDIDTADMYDSGGAIDAVWADAALAGTADGQNKSWVAFSVPALDADKRWAITLYENASPADTDAIKAGPWRYDPSLRMAFSDTNLLHRGSIPVTTTRPD